MRFATVGRAVRRYPLGSKTHPGACGVPANRRRESPGESFTRRLTSPVRQCLLARRASEGEAEPSLARRANKNGPKPHGKALRTVGICALFALVCFCHAFARAEPLPGTKPLEEKGDLAKIMVDGINKYLDREMAAAAEKRKQFWKL